MKRTIKFFQHLFITIQMYGQNGLANHAAACAYAFLLSMAPTLLLMAFFIFIAFQSSPRTISALITSIPIINSIFDEQWLSSDLFSVSRPLVPSIIFIVSIIWAGRILALSIQRGLGTIFPAQNKRSAFKSSLVTLAIEGALVIFVLVIIISSRTALRFYRMLDFLPHASIVRYITSQTGGQVLYTVLLGLATFLVYILVPIKPPKKLSAFMGSFICGVCSFCTAFALNFILDRGRYNFLYGTFGNLIIILVNVYFFFMFFFIGAQFAYVRDSFNELPPSLTDVIFKKDSSINKAIQKYKNRRKKAEVDFD